MSEENIPLFFTTFWSRFRLKLNPQTEAHLDNNIILFLGTIIFFIFFKEQKISPGLTFFKK